MNPRVFLDVDPRDLHVPSTRLTGADPVKLHRQIAQYGHSVSGMPTIEVNRGSDGKIQIANGVTRATRVAKLLPGQTVRVEIMEDMPYPVGQYPTIQETLP